jgi:intracellular multiplication protein IcmE
MKPGNLLPGGLEGTPAQDALLKTDSQEKARKAGEKHESYTPPMPSSNSFNGRLPTEVGMGEPQEFEPTIAKVETPPGPAIVPEPSPAFTPPEPLAPERELNGARVERVASDDGAAEAAAAEAQGAHQQRQKAIGDMLRLEFQAAADDGRAGAGGLEGRRGGSSGARQGGRKRDDA